MKYTFYYPENGYKVMNIGEIPVVEFESVDEAHLFLAHISDDWKEIQTQSQYDIAAYLNEGTGDALVLRQVIA